MALSGSDIAVTNSTATVLGTTNASGSLTLTSDGAVTKLASGTVISVVELATITTTGDDITVDGTANNFGSIAVTGALVTLTEASATDLGTSVVTGAFSLTSGGAITDRGTLTFSGATATFSTAGFSITLDQSFSTFGTLILTGKNIAVTENAATVLGNTTATGTITSAGIVTDLGTTAGEATLNVAGQVTLTVSVGTGVSIS